MFITGKRIPRRTFLRDVGTATLALPFLDAMRPAGRISATTAASLDPTRLVCIEMVHGAAGSNAWGATQHLWSPATTGRTFDLGSGALAMASSCVIEGCGSSGRMFGDDGTGCVVAGTPVVSISLSRSK